MPPRNWQALVEQMSPVMKLVHLAMRQDSFDEEQTRTELLRIRRNAYEKELTRQAVRVGCKGRRGRLTNGAVLSELNEVSRQDAAGIANTFNYDLAAAIVRVKSEVPTANRFVYAKRLREWQGIRGKWKEPQIMLNSQQTARSLAQRHFYEFNGSFGIAVLRPRTAVCPICQGWINRGEVPLRVAQNNPPPYHQNCPHFFETQPDKWAREECPNLWMGA